MRLLTFFLLTGSALAADRLEQLAPERIGQNLPQRSTGTSARIPLSTQDGEILLPSLLDVVIEGDDSPALRLLLKPYLGKPVTLATLQRLRAELEQWFVASDQPVTQVILPPQEITSGTITYQIHPRMAGRVLLQGKTVFGRKFITGAFTTRPGDRVSAAQVTRDLIWMNENPFRRVDITYADGQDRDHADLLLKLSENRPWRFFAGWNNQSNERLGDHRLLAGASFGNLWGADHQLSVQWLTALDRQELGAFAATYVIPLPWRHHLELSTIFSRSDTTLSDDLDLSGEVRRGALKYRIPLPSQGNWRPEVFLGAEYQENHFTLLSADGRRSGREATLFNLSAGGGTPRGGLPGLYPRPFGRGLEPWDCRSGGRRLRQAPGRGRCQLVAGESGPGPLLVAAVGQHPAHFMGRAVRRRTTAVFRTVCGDRLQRGPWL